MNPHPKRAPVIPLPSLEVSLSTNEQDICALLDDFCQTKNKNNPTEEPLVCRIAGGWVRDKVSLTQEALEGIPNRIQLLGLDSHDIDIAINKMTGEAFAKDLLDAGKVESVGVTIASNPEQSKHLATTRLKLLGTEVDLVNLRSETYSNESRIPTMVSLIPYNPYYYPLIGQTRSTERLCKMPRDVTSL